MNRRVLLLWGGLALVGGVFASQVARKEAILHDGAVVLLPLAPVDPRSLLQGDYMSLRYAIMANSDWPTDGLLKLRLDANGVAALVGVARPGEPLGPGEVVLRYRRRGWQTRIGAEAFYFQEGDADLYAHAKYGELRVASSGESVLVGLRDQDREPMHRSISK